MTLSRGKVLLFLRAAYIDLYILPFTFSGRAASIIIILGGSIYFTWVKHVESLSPPSASAEKRREDDEKDAGYKPVATEDLESGPSERDMEEKQ